MKNLLNSLNGRLLCAAAVLFMVVGLFVGGAQPFAVGLLTEPWDKLAHATVFAVLTALLADAVGICFYSKPAPSTLVGRNSEGVDHFNPKNNYVVTSLYFYDEQVCDIAASIDQLPEVSLKSPMSTATFLELGQLSVEIMGRGFAWLDTGTHLHIAARRQLHQYPPKRQGLRLSCPQEISLAPENVSLAGWFNSDKEDANDENIKGALHARIQARRAQARGRWPKHRSASHNAGRG